MCSQPLRQCCPRMVHLCRPGMPASVPACRVRGHQKERSSPCSWLKALQLDIFLSFVLCLPGTGTLYKGSPPSQQHAEPAYCAHKQAAAQAGWWGCSASYQAQVTQASRHTTPPMAESCNAYAALLCSVTCSSCIFLSSRFFRYSCREYCLQARWTFRDKPHAFAMAGQHRHLSWKCVTAGSPTL